MATLSSRQAMGRENTRFIRAQLGACRTRLSVVPTQLVAQRSYHFVVLSCDDEERCDIDLRTREHSMPRVTLHSTAAVARCSTCRGSRVFEQATCISNCSFC
jgi:hypothetical protein